MTDAVCDAVLLTEGESARVTEVVEDSVRDSDRTKESEGDSDGPAVEVKVIDAVSVHDRDRDSVTGAVCDAVLLTEGESVKVTEVVVDGARDSDRTKDSD